MNKEKHPKYEVRDIETWPKQDGMPGLEALSNDLMPLLKFQTTHVVRHGYNAPDLSPDIHRRRMCLNVVAQDRRTKTIVAAARLTIAPTEDDLLLIGLENDCDVEWPLGVIDFVGAAESEALPMTELVRLAPVYTAKTLAVKQGEAPFAGVFARENLMYSHAGLRHVAPLDPWRQTDFRPTDVDPRSYAMYRISDLEPLIEDEPDAWASSNPGFTTM